MLNIVTICVKYSSIVVFLTMVLNVWKTENFNVIV